VFPGKVRESAEAGRLLTVLWGVGSSLLLFSYPGGMDALTCTRPRFLQDGCKQQQAALFTVKMQMHSHDSFQFKIKFKASLCY